jgi:hypothetical protein
VNRHEAIETLRTRRDYLERVRIPGKRAIGSTWDEREARARGVALAILTRDPAAAFHDQAERTANDIEIETAHHSWTVRRDRITKELKEAYTLGQLSQVNPRPESGAAPEEGATGTAEDWPEGDE